MPSATAPQKVSGSANPVAEAFEAPIQNMKASGNGEPDTSHLSAVSALASERVTAVSHAAVAATVLQLVK